MSEIPHENTGKLLTTYVEKYRAGIARVVSVEFNKGLAGTGLNSNPNDIEDVIQDIMLLLVQESTKNPNKKVFFAYIKTVSIRVTRRYLATNLPTMLAQSLDAPIKASKSQGDGSSTTAEDYLVDANSLRDFTSVESEDLLKDALHLIRSKCGIQIYEALLYIVFDGISVKEAAERLNLTYGSLRTANSRTRKILEDDTEVYTILTEFLSYRKPTSQT